VIGAAVMTRFRLFRGRAGPAIGSQVAQQRRGAADRSEHREAAGPVVARDERGQNK